MSKWANLLTSQWALLLVLAVLPLFVGGAVLTQVTTLLCYMLLALGLHVVVGYTGALHLGIAAFFGIGAFTAGILTTANNPFQIGFFPGAIAATFAAGLAGFVLAAPLLRLRGDYLALVTLGFGEVLQVTMRNYENITNGTQTINRIPPPLDFSTPWLVPLATYFIALIFVALTVVVLLNLERSRLGRAWIALREDELAANCMGVNTSTARLAAFTLGAALAGLAGAVYVASLSNTSQPENRYNFNTSIIMLCCLILGGLGSIRGVLFGVVILMGLDEIITPIIDQQLAIYAPTDSALFRLSSWRLMIFGLALILMMRFRPEGLLPARHAKEELHEEDVVAGAST